MTAVDWGALRKRFPVLVERTYLATHSFGPVSLDTLADLDEYRRSIGLRNRALAGWFERIEEIRQLPATLRARLAEAFRADTIVGTDVRPADGGLTGKALHRLADDRLVESVLMRYPARGERRARATLCISSQAGCAVGCPFCATGELGFWRDLETAEIAIAMHPTSALFKKGHRIRLAIGGADKDTLARIPQDETPQWTIERKRSRA